MTYEAESTSMSLEEPQNDHPPMPASVEEYEKAILKAIKARNSDEAVRLLKLSRSYNGFAINRLHGNNTLLGWACAYSLLEVVRELLSKGADPRTKYNNTSTPLCVAVINNQYEIAKALLKAGADPNTRDGNGNCPIYAALHNRNDKMVALLEQYGVNININPYPGQNHTPLKLAKICLPEKYVWLKEKADDSSREVYDFLSENNGATRTRERMLFPEKYGDLENKKKRKRKSSDASRLSKKRKVDVSDDLPMAVDAQIPKIKKTTPSRVKKFIPENVMKLVKLLRGNSNFQQGSISYAKSVVQYFKTGELPVKPCPKQYDEALSFDVALMVPDRKDLAAGEPYVEYCYIKEPMKYDNLNDALKRKASENPSHVLSGCIELVRSGMHALGPGRMIAFFATPDEVWYVDCLEYDGKNDKDNNSIFSDISNKYQWFDKIKKPGVDVYLDTVNCIDPSRLQEINKVVAGASSSTTTTTTPTANLATTPTVLLQRKSLSALEELQLALNGGRCLAPSSIAPHTSLYKASRSSDERHPEGFSQTRLLPQNSPVN